MSAEDDRRARLARVYDAEVLPAYASRFAFMLLRALAPRQAARVLEIGCATGFLTRELARRLDTASHLTAIDDAPALVAVTRTKIEADGEARLPVSLQVAAPTPLPVEDGAMDLVVSNLAIAGAVDPAAAVREAARVLAPGGQLVIATPLRGTWAEFLDLYADVLRDRGKLDNLAALERHVAALPDADTAAGWLDAAGLVHVEVEVERWEILFKSAREFFFAPLVELGPLAQWKRLSGRGEDMQDDFLAAKQAIDAYYKRRPFAATVVGAAIQGWNKFLD